MTAPSQSRRRLADKISRYLIQQLKHRNDSRKPNPQPNHPNQRRAPRSRSPRRCYPRAPGWRPIFGQAGAAQTHLARNNVGAGDLFLFFGSFQRAEMENGTLRFQHSTPRLHIIFGWLQIAAVHQVTNGLTANIPWAARHPHLTTPDRYNHNTVYVASSNLSSIALDIPGAGVFEQLRPELVLTETNPYKRMHQLDSPPMVPSQLSPPTHLSLRSQKMDQIPIFDAPKISPPRPGIHPRSNPLPRIQNLAPQNLPPLSLAPVRP